MHITINQDQQLEAFLDTIEPLLKGLMDAVQAARKTTLRQTVSSGPTPFYGVPDNLRKLREAKGLTQEELAIRCMTTSMTISRLERGRSLRPRRVLEAMLRSVLIG